MPLHCPLGLQLNECYECPRVSDDGNRCNAIWAARNLSEILTDTERIARLEAVSHGPLIDCDMHVGGVTKHQIQHLQAQINYLEKRLIKVEARKKRYVGY